MIEAKPALYRGILFRSQLEARWAILLDLIGIRYLYEPKKFETPHGWYLPDFWLSDLDVWLELKPDTMTGPEIIERQKAQAVADLENRPCFIVCGFPLYSSSSNGVYLYLPRVKVRPVSVQTMTEFLPELPAAMFYAAAGSANTRLESSKPQFVFDAAFMMCAELGMVDRYAHNEGVQESPRESFDCGLGPLKELRGLIELASNEVFNNLKCLQAG